MQLLFTALAPTDVQKKIIFYTLKNLRHVSAKYMVTRLAETCSSLLYI